jgi:hypothetical protein
LVGIESAVVQHVAWRPTVIVADFSQPQHGKMSGVVGHGLADTAAHFLKPSPRLCGNIVRQFEFFARGLWFGSFSFQTIDGS